MGLREYSGKKVATIYFGKEGEVCIRANEKEKKEIVLETEYHGEYDLVWFVVLKDGVEESRHNAKFVETVEWLNPKGA